MMNNVEFTSGEISLIYIAVEDLRDTYEEMLEDKSSYLPFQVNNMIDNLAVCNSVLRKLKKQLDAAGLSIPQ